MYRPEDLKTGLKSLWGWRQNYNQKDFTISDSLTSTETGQVYQDIHPLITLENLRSVCPDFTNIDHDEWLAIMQYKKGDRVILNEITYKALIDNVGLSPNSNSTEWEVFDSFSEWLDLKTEASILKAIRSFWDEKMSQGTAKNILESKVLFNGAGRMTDTILSSSSLVGFELVPLRSNGVTLRIDKIGLQFTEASSITVKLYHSSSSTPIKEKVCVRTKANSIEWFDASDFLLPYLSDDTDAGGSWYLVYDQGSIGSSLAINKTKDWSAKPCYSCSNSDSQYHRVWSKYLEIHPFKVGSFVDGQMWDVADNIYTYTSNYGINLQISIECDITDIILQQKTAFQNIIGLQVAIDCLREFAYNPNFRIGRTQQNFSRMEILYELDGDSQSYKKSGLMHSFNNAMKSVKLDTTDMSRVCFPCNNKGVRYKTV